MDSVQQPTPGLPVPENAAPAAQQGGIIQQAQQQEIAAQDTSGEQATPEEQKEYERAANAVARIVYGTDQETSDTIADSVIAEDKIGSLTQAALSVFTQVDKKIDIDEAVMAQVVEDTVEMVADVAEKKNGIFLTEDELGNALIATWEGVIFMMGGDSDMAEDYAELTAGMSEQEIVGIQQEFGARLEGVKQQREQGFAQVENAQPTQQIGGPANG